MKTFLLICVAGSAGAGKDTATNMLRDHFGFATYAFAYPIKAALNAMFGWDMALWDNREWKEAVIPDIGKSPRQLAQTLGTEWGRDLVNPKLWLLLAKRRHDAALCAGLPGLVISDCRFNNEAQFAHELGGVVVHIHRDGVGAVAAHASENALSPGMIDHRILNNGTLQELEEYLAVLMARIDRDADA
jgi:hypothetical protein